MKQPIFTKTLSGYTAITMAIVLSLVFMAIGTSMAFTSFVSRVTTLGTTLKYGSGYGAEACLEEGLLRLSLNNAYRGDETITVSNDAEAVVCTILPIETSGENMILKTRTAYRGRTRNTVTNYILTVHGATLARVSLAEVSRL